MHTVLKIGNTVTPKGRMNKYRSRPSFNNQKTTSRRIMVTVTIGAVQAGIIVTRAVIITANQETVRTIFVDHGKGHQHSGD